jgi:protease YdgD
MRLRFTPFLLPIVLSSWLGFAAFGALFPNRGDQEARRVADSHQPAFSSIGKLIGAATCTGTLVLEPRIVVTAAHCVAGADGLLVKDVSFWLGDPSDMPFDGFQGRVEGIGSTRQYAGHTIEDEPKDWAIIRLNESPPNARPLPLRHLRRSELLQLRGRISLPAYTREADKHVPADRSCSILDIRWDVFIHDCSASPGSSGAPLLVESEDGIVVVGINSASLYIPSSDVGPGAFAGAAVRSSSFEAALMSVRDRLSQR